MFHLTGRSNLGTGVVVTDYAGSLDCENYVMFMHTRRHDDSEAFLRDWVVVSHNELFAVGGDVLAIHAETDNQFKSGECVDAIEMFKSVAAFFDQTEFAAKLVSHILSCEITVLEGGCAGEREVNIHIR